MKQALLALAIVASAVAHGAAPTVEEVGDADSFRNNVIYLGSAQTSGISLLEDCTPDPEFPPPADERCITLNAQPAPTAFDESGLDSIELRGGVSKSLLCFALTPFVNFQFNNQTGVPQPNARFTAQAVITIESEVLDDPALIDPNTGLPFGGQMVLPLSTYGESRSIGVGERAQKNMFLSRSCIGGLVSKQSLIGSGLSAAQANQFFSRPITLTFGARGTVQIVDGASYFYGIRLYGDR
jgi:hypothetical protein